MNKQQIQGQWNQLKGKVKEKWGELTDDEINQINGNYDQLVGTIQQKYGYQKERAQQEVDNWQ